MKSDCESRSSWSSRGGEEAVLGTVSADDTGMREAAEDREVVAELGQRREVRGQLVVAPGCLRKKWFRQHTEIVRDEQHASRTRRLRRSHGFRRQRFEQRQGEDHTRTAQKAATTNALVNHEAAPIHEKSGSAPRHATDRARGSRRRHNDRVSHRSRRGRRIARGCRSRRA